MDFFTRIDIPAADFKIDYESRIAFFGSCFADKISAQFAARKFDVFANPFGTVYNPLSIARQIRAIADEKVFGENDVFQDAHGPWHSWIAHGSLSASTREECIANLNDAATRAREFLEKADVVFITLGTAFVYFLKESGEAVANCHRQDATLFERRMIGVEEASRALECITQDLRKIAAPSARNDDRKPHVVFTVSPLRHMADGAHNNTLSKATLQLASANRLYFPSYEIVMDELRDYRFYESDMVHLSKTAEEFIFERMAETYCSETTRDHIRKVERFMKSAGHRMADPDSAASRDFAQKLRAQAAELEAQVPGLDLG
jgi:lysophospholipase L1-like esterase